MTLGLAASGVRAQPAAQHLTFVAHATFFSQETNRTPPIDPQVFVHDGTAPAGTGPQDIDHVAGVRPARLDDSLDLVAYNANGDSLGFTLGKWFGASGAADLSPAANGTRVSLNFKKLIPFGVYTAFRITFASGGATFDPLDGAGTGNGFTAGADGGAELTIVSPDPLESGNAIVLVYHSDAKQHGTLRGPIGITAHHQLIVRLP